MNPKENSDKDNRPLSDASDLTFGNPHAWSIDGMRFERVQTGDESRPKQEERTEIPASGALKHFKVIEELEKEWNATAQAAEPNPSPPPKSPPSKAIAQLDELLKMEKIWDTAKTGGETIKSTERRTKSSER